MTRFHLRRGPRLAVTLVSLITVSVVAASCSQGQSESLDRSATERAVGKVVASEVTKQVGDDVEVTTTRCPADIPRSPGKVVMCNITLGGVAGKVRARVRQMNGDGRLDVALLDVVLDNAKVSDELVAQLRKQFARSFQADCGKGLRIVTPKAGFRCRARDADSRRTVQVTVADAAGTLRFQVLS